MKRNRSKIRVLISSVFAFILTLLIVILFVCLGFSFGVFNNRSIINKLDESNYYNQIYNDYNQNAEELVQKSGFPVKIVQESLTFDRVYVGGLNYVKSILAGEEAQINTIKLHNDLVDGINRYLTEQGVVRTEELNAGIEGLVFELENSFVSSIQLKFADYYMEYKSEFTDLMKVIMPVDIILIGILCFFLIRMHRFKHRGLRYINYAMISSSCMTLLSAAYLLISKKYNKIDAAPEYYQKFIAAYLKWDITVFLYIGGIGLIIALFLVSLTGYLRKKVTNG